MTQVYNLYRFGIDEFAVGHLINGDFPTDDEARWRVLKAPEYHIRRLLNEHRRAQLAIADAVRTRRPFVLYLRSFSSEFAGMREGQAVAGLVDLNSMKFQSWIRRFLDARAAPLIRLHGGSDGFHAGDEDVCVLSTHSENWEAVAEELIEHAGAIVFLLSDLNPGVRLELERIRAQNRCEHCVVAIPNDDDAPRDPPAQSARSEEIRAHVADFEHVFVLPHESREGDEIEGVKTALQCILDAAPPPAACPETQAAGFTYLERDFTESEAYERTQAQIWTMMRELRVFVDDAYWRAIQDYGVSIAHLNFDNAWKAAHQIYGLAIAVADFHAIAEALQHLFKLSLRRNADLALLIPTLKAQYHELANDICEGPPADTEQSHGSGAELMSLPTDVNTAIRLYELACKKSNPGLASLLYFAALIYALKAEHGEQDPRWIAANIAQDWATWQFAKQFEHWGIANLELAVAIFRRLADEDPGEYKTALGRGLNNLGKHFLDLGDAAKAESALREALSIRRELGAATKEDTVNLYNGLGNLAWLLATTQREDQALELYDEALAVCRLFVCAHPEAASDSVRLQAWRAQALAALPDRLPDAARAADAAERELDAASIDRELRDALRDLIATVRIRLGDNAEQSRPHESRTKTSAPNLMGSTRHTGASARSVERAPMRS